MEITKELSDAIKAKSEAGRNVMAANAACATAYKEQRDALASVVKAEMARVIIVEKAEKAWAALEDVEPVEDY